MLSKNVASAIGAGFLALLLGSASHATTITFSSGGSFGTPTNCGGFPTCSVSGGPNGANTVLDMSGGNNSTLTAVDHSGSVSTPQNNLILGEILWDNNASGGFLTPTDQNFNVNYTFALSFTAPSGYSDSQLFSLNITQPTNPPGDHVLNISDATLQGLNPFSLAGVNVTDLHFLVSGVGSTYNGGTGDWFTPENGISHLYVVADFNDVVVTPQTPVPEPVSIAALGTGLMALAGVLGWRNRRKEEDTDNNAAS